MLWSLITGLIAGVIAGKIMKYDEPWWKDMLMGLLGGVVGGWIADFINVDTSGWILSIVFAVIGACVICGLYRFIKGKMKK